LFEVGHVFRHPQAPQPLPDEREHLGVALAGSEAPEAVRLVDALLRALGYPEHRLDAETMPGLHPGRSAALTVGGMAIGVVGEVDPGVCEAFDVSEPVAWVELDLGRLLELQHGDLPYRTVSRFPSSDIDLAFEVDESVPAAAVADALRAAAGQLLVGIELFDVYRGDGIEAGRRSLAYRLRFQASDRTLTDGDIAAVRQRCIETVEAATMARLRG
jgi:phenylalanyl-tRNA synthetase beta chain